MFDRIKQAIAGFVGTGLVLAAGTVFLDGSQHSVQVATEVPNELTKRAVDERGATFSVRVRDPLLVVNRDGSATVGAYLENENDVEVALAGVVVSVNRRPLAVNATPWWLPLPAGERSQVGAASDAGGFLIPAGIRKGTRADIEFRFDDGTCMPANVIAVARTDQHRTIYPKTGRPIGPVTTDEPPAGTTSCLGGSKVKTLNADRLKS